MKDIARPFAALLLVSTLVGTPGSWGQVPGGPTKKAAGARQHTAAKYRA